MKAKILVVDDEPDLDPPSFLRRGAPGRDGGA